MFNNRIIKLIVAGMLLVAVTFLVQDVVARAGNEPAVDPVFHTPPMSDYSAPVDNVFHTPPMSDYSTAVDNVFHTPPMSDYPVSVDYTFHTPPMSDYSP
jgi:hypothetical protein